jgi:hypothetical protein
VGPRIDFLGPVADLQEVVRLTGFRDHRGFDDLFAIVRTLARLEEKPPGHVVGGGVDRAGGRHIVNVIVRGRHDFSIDQTVGRRNVAHRLEGGSASVAPVHPERREDALVDEVLPADVGHSRDNLACHQEHGVRVPEAGSEVEGRLQQAKAVEGVGPVVNRAKPRQVPDECAETTAVAEEIADRDLAGDQRIVQLELRHVAEDRIVPRNLAVLHQQTHRRRGERLRARTDAEEGVGVDLATLLEVAHTEAFGEDHLLVLDYGDGSARDLPSIHLLLDVGLEPGEGAGFDLRKRRNGDEYRENRCRPESAFDTLHRYCPFQCLSDRHSPGR